MTVSFFARAISINNAAFVKYGGDINNTLGTYRTVYLNLAKESYSKQYLAVGRISANCTGTWLGDSPNRKYIYVLTAAHCIPYKESTGQTSVSFWDHKGWLVGQDGTYYIPSKRLYDDLKTSDGRVQNDIAVLQLEKVRSILDLAGNMIPAPVLNDVNDEVNKVVNLVGYGYWGSEKDGKKMDWYPVYGSLRAWGASKVSLRSFESAKQFLVAYRDSSEEKWALGEPGDSGSAWWQTQNHRRYYIVGINSAAGANYSVATRIFDHKDWIKNLGKVLRWRSSPEKGCMLLTWSNFLGNWEWRPTPWIKTESECNAKNECSVHRSCYRWDMLP